jgi:lipid II:glycine glycyltransferase (peptidoglycan interpeptide bridge formation enzyme)
VILDLRQGEDGLLAGMKSKTRYNVRLSARRGVEVEEGGAEKLGLWYGLHRETATRDRIAVRQPAYFTGLFEAAESYPGRRPEYRILLARADGELLGGIVVCFWGRRAWYLYGASSARRRNLMPNYALQWQAVRLALERGCREYDLFGIPPSADPSHPMAGLFQFKTGFGGRIENRLGPYDAVYRPAVYRAYGAAEALRRFYFKTIKKRTGL